MQRSQNSRPLADSASALLTLSGPAVILRQAEAAEQRAAARLEAALESLCSAARRREAVERRLRREGRPAVRAALFRQLDSLEPIVETGEDLVAALAGEHTVALARLYGAGGRCREGAR